MSTQTSALMDPLPSTTRANILTQTSSGLQYNMTEQGDIRVSSRHVPHVVPCTTHHVSPVSSEASCRYATIRNVSPSSPVAAGLNVGNIYEAQSPRTPSVDSYAEPMESLTDKLREDCKRLKHELHVSMLEQEEDALNKRLQFELKLLEKAERYV